MNKVADDFRVTYDATRRKMSDPPPDPGEWDAIMDFAAIGVRLEVHTDPDPQAVIRVARWWKAKVGPTDWMVELRRGLDRHPLPGAGKVW